VAREAGRGRPLNTIVRHHVNDHLVIRLATRKDAEAIALESMAEIEHNFDWTWHPLRVGRAISDPNTNVVVAIEGDAMVGFGIMEYEEEVAHLVLFGVREDMRRQGVGSALLAWLEKVATVAGVNRFRVEARLTNSGARAFYQKHGYVESEVVPGMYRDTEDGVRFEKVAATAMKEA
jgi:ribosomal protein S18 acetylase RimI-like enzyme